MPLFFYRGQSESSQSWSSRLVLGRPLVQACVGRIHILREPCTQDHQDPPSFPVARLLEDFDQSHQWSGQVKSSVIQCQRVGDMMKALPPCDPVLCQLCRFVYAKSRPVHDVLDRCLLLGRSCDRYPGTHHTSSLFSSSLPSALVRSPPIGFAQNNNNFYLSFWRL